MKVHEIPMVVPVSETIFENIDKVNEFLSQALLDGSSKNIKHNINMLFNILSSNDLAVLKEGVRFTEVLLSSVFKGELHEKNICIKNIENYNHNGHLFIKEMNNFGVKLFNSIEIEEIRANKLPFNKDTYVSLIKQQKIKKINNMTFVCMDSTVLRNILGMAYLDYNNINVNNLKLIYGMYLNIMKNLIDKSQYENDIETSVLLNNYYLMLEK